MSTSNLIIIIEASTSWSKLIKQTLMNPFTSDLKQVIHDNMINPKIRIHQTFVVYKSQISK